MNNTNRALNRLLILLVGILLLVLGIAGAMTGAVAGIRDGWKSSAPSVHDTVTGWLKATPLADTGTSWLWIPILAVLVIVVIVLLVFIFQQGHGQTGAVLTEPTTEHGRTIVEATVAEQAIQDSLADRPELIASHVSTYSVRGTPMLKIATTARRGVSPREVVDIVEQSLTSLDELLGTEIPALIQISGGFRAQVAKSTRLQ